MGTLRGKRHGPLVENCCIFQFAPLVAAHLRPHNGNHILAQHVQYRWQTHMGWMWVPCGSFERQNTWVPRGKLLHKPVCPISGSPRVAHEWHTRGSFMGPMEFCYLGDYLYKVELKLIYASERVPGSAHVYASPGHQGFYHLWRAVCSFGNLTHPILSASGGVMGVHCINHGWCCLISKKSSFSRPLDMRSMLLNSFRRSLIVFAWHL